MEIGGGKKLERGGRFSLYRISVWNQWGRINITEWSFAAFEREGTTSDKRFFDFGLWIVCLFWTDFLSIFVTAQFLDDKRLPTVYAFALVEHVRKFFETRLLRVRLYLAGEFSNFNTDNVQSCPRLFNMRSHICETERQLYFMKVTCSILYSCQRKDVVCLSTMNFNVFITMTFLGYYYFHLRIKIFLCRHVCK